MRPIVPEWRLTVQRIPRLAVLVGALVAFLPADLRASGGSSMPRGGGPSMPSAPRKTPEQEAVDYYNAGIKYRDKAMDYLKDAEQAKSDKERTKLEGKAEKEFGRAVSQFRTATEKNPNFYQALSDLGFALRKTGDYTGALEVYARAIGLEPTYSPAIEYRGEAYLGLDRVEDSKKAYMQLFTIDRGEADKLLKAMKGWVEKRRTDPGKLAADAVQEFSGWVAEREQLAGQTPSVSELQQRKW
jgi:tetratricopeptide (TPR) repeat protein